MSDLNSSRLVFLLLLGTALVSTAGSQAEPPPDPDDLPFEVTEVRERCANYAPEKQALFGSTHLHTGLSFDASIYFVDYKKNNPRTAYKFAQGGYKIQIPQPSGMQRSRLEGEPLGIGPTRTPEIDQPLDWGAVTDHAEHFGVMGMCKGVLGEIRGQISMVPGEIPGVPGEILKVPGEIPKVPGEIPGVHSLECRMLNNFFYKPGQAVNQAFGVTVAASAFTQLATASDAATSHNTRLPVCENNPETCDLAELAVWAEVRAAAEEAYDRTSACKFTSMIGYENTSSPLGYTWHRNVIFRNDRVAERPITAIDMAVQPNNHPTKIPISTVGGVVATPEDLARVSPVPAGHYDHPLPQPFWNKLENHCKDGLQVTLGLDSHCDFITIPHNTNLGGGLPGIFPPSFLTPYNKKDAIRHQEMETLVEIYQVKGSSECRYDPRFPPSQQTTKDELCSFEILDSSQGSNVPGQTSSNEPNPPSSFPRRSYVRAIWEDGLKFAAEGKGVNPFKMGVVAGSDAHNGVLGWHPENEQWPGHAGINTSFPVADETIQYGTGGFSVVWAEENSRDSIFSALRRKESYGTSGTRIQARFFGAWDLPRDACSQDFVSLGYSNGVPMGGDLPPRPAGKAGEAPVFVAAAWSDPNLQTPLQRIQIIKASADSDGNLSQKIMLVAGSNTGSPPLQPGTCDPQPGKAPQMLCGVWRDHEFDPDDHAMYYVRVIEEPVCRYSTLWCQTYIKVNPLLSSCVGDLEKLSNGTKEEKLRASRGAMCCQNETTDPFVQPMIQERAWTSPIWYEPAAQ